MTLRFAKGFIISLLMVISMVSGNSRLDELEADIQELEHRMYQVEDVLGTLQEEISELKQRSSRNELSKL